MEKENEKERNVVNHFEAGANCQVFNGDISGGVFNMPGADDEQSDQELCLFVHPSVVAKHEWQVHNEVSRLVRRQGIQEICRHLHEMRKDKKVLLPQSPSAAYEELVRMGMPSGEGFNESTFRKYYLS